ncbi:hypothetical protein A3F66_06705 [candidate division TM6 bacterium RIFCSPHIGHO2_12_FULL_32_22]|nr:MAG: hypothetical protein A3F66_06705 [candidate division TM6 bacterium RIFCSPHIGHO2_12_FULL_32_22]
MKIFIIYDGINNSVFQSQVLAPFKKEAEKSNDKFLIISFEKKFLDVSLSKPARTLRQAQGERPLMVSNVEPYERLWNNSNALYKNHEQIEIIQFKRLPFLGKFSLFLSKIKLRKFLNKLDTDYTIKARGPLAGWIALKAQTSRCKEIIVQARGILVEEYEMAHPKSKNILVNTFNSWRKKQLRLIEKYVYSTSKIEAVSTALVEYLKKNYGTDKKLTTIAKDDIPEKISAAQKTSWSDEIRKELNIPVDSYVYCYNGSAKPWQCPKETVNFFKEELKENNNIFLLILSQDKKIFEELLIDADRTKYRILNVNNSEIMRYLSAADAGLIFRDNNIVNWVSRPTKALEYKAAHLEIIHNNMVNFLDQKQTHIYLDADNDPI